MIEPRGRPLHERIVSDRDRRAGRGKRDRPVDLERQQLPGGSGRARRLRERLVGAEHGDTRPAGTPGGAPTSDGLVDGSHQNLGIAGSLMAFEHQPRLEREPARPGAIVLATAVEQE